MTLKLNMGTEPDGLEVKTNVDGDDIVHIGDYELSIEDFFITAHYVLTNTDLRENDSRLQFVRSVNYMYKTVGYNPDGVRLYTIVPPAESVKKIEHMKLPTVKTEEPSNG